MSGRLEMETGVRVVDTREAVGPPWWPKNDSRLAKKNEIDCLQCCSSVVRWWQLAPISLHFDSCSAAA